MDINNFIDQLNATINNTVTTTQDSSSNNSIPVSNVSENDTSNVQDNSVKKLKFLLSALILIK